MKEMWLLKLVIFLILILPLTNIKVYAQSKNIIQTQAGGFNPSQIEIQKGETVTFKNTDNQDHWPASDIHPTHQIYPEFDPKKPIPPGKSWEFKFDRVGQWGYHDHLNPSSTGQIIVKSDGISGTADNPNLKESLLDSIQNFFSNLSQKIISKFRASQPKLQTSKLPSSYDLNQIYSNLNFICSKSDFNCTKEKLIEVTKNYGPKAAVEVLALLQQNNRIERSVDDHQLAHQIGRQTAQTFGLSAQVFLLCPMSAYNGGCQHGYFEQVLGQAKSAKEAAQSICEGAASQFSAKDHFYCYHGVGHGVMMAQAYNLEGSLAICDQLGTRLVQDGCWQGVFMENANAAMKGQARPGLFSKDDPLSPCDKVEDKYRHECFINHAGWLMSVSGNNFGQAANFCLKAPQNFISSCLQSIGLMVTNPVWQVNFIGNQNLSFEQKAWQLCQKFPPGYIEQCVLGAIDNIINFDQFNLTRAKAFCQQVGQLGEKCFQRVGFNLKNQQIQKNQAESSCQKLDSKDQVKFCLDGIRI